MTVRLVGMISWLSSAPYLIRSPHTVPLRVPVVSVDSWKQAAKIY